MEQTQLCPACGAANPIDRKSCQICAQLFYPEPQPWENLKPQELPSRNPSETSSETGPRFQVPSHIKPIRTTTRRKVLAGLVGSAAILGLGVPALTQLFQNVEVAFTTRNFPDDLNQNFSSLCFSPDLNLMAVYKDRGQDGMLYIWDYEQQRMTSFSATPGFGLATWSPDGKYLLGQETYTDNSQELHIWNVQTHQSIRSTKNSYKFNNDYNFYDSDVIHWSPDSSRIALLLDSSFVILNAANLMPVSTFRVTTQGQTFVWSPDGRKLALLVGKYGVSDWSIQIWDAQTQTMETEVHFQGVKQAFENTLAWSPDGSRIAAISNGQLQIIHLTQTVSSYTLDEPNDYGRLAWAPDSKQLAVAVNQGPDGSSFNFSNRFGIWDVVARSKMHVLNNGTVFSSMPRVLAWAKDGGHLTSIGQFYQQENWYWL